MKILITAVVLVLLPSVALAAKPTAIDPGMTDISLDGKSHDLVIKAYRENFNAHSFYSFVFYGKDKGFQIIPFEQADKTKPLVDEMATLQGADCILRDYRLVALNNKIYVLEASRDVGNGFADTTDVKFTLYGIARNNDGVSGLPERYFTVIRTWKSGTKRCDVTESFSDPALDRQISAKK